MSGPASGEIYKPFRNPNKFEGVLNPLWRDGDDVIYQVGQAHASLARVVPRAALVARTPVHGGDVDPLRPYVAALDDPQMPRAKFRWIDAHTAEITGNLQANQALSVQIAWHSGWHATANAKPIPVKRDGIGQIALDPGPGAATIRLIYDGGTEMRIARLLSALAAIFLRLACFFYSVINSGRTRETTPTQEPSMQQRRV